jgi:hypothetical protein
MLRGVGGAPCEGCPYPDSSCADILFQACLLPLQPSDQYLVQPQNFFHRCPGFGVISFIGLPHFGHSCLSSTSTFFIVLVFFDFVLAFRLNESAEKTLLVRDESISHLACQIP